MVCMNPECQTTAGCQCQPYSMPLLPVARQFYPVNIPLPQWDNEVTVARLTKDGKLTIASEYPSPA